MEPDQKKSTTPDVAKHRQIDENLRRIYDSTLNEELPDRFHTLLAQLKSGQKENSDGR